MLRQVQQATPALPLALAAAALPLALAAAALPLALAPAAAMPVAAAAAAALKAAALTSVGFRCGGSRLSAAVARSNAATCGAVALQYVQCGGAGRGSMALTESRRRRYPRSSFLHGVALGLYSGCGQMSGQLSEPSAFRRSLMKVSLGEILPTVYYQDPLTILVRGAEE